MTSNQSAGLGGGTTRVAEYSESIRQPFVDVEDSPPGLVLDTRFGMNVRRGGENMTGSGKSTNKFLLGFNSDWHGRGIGGLLNQLELRAYIQALCLQRGCDYVLGFAFAMPLFFCVLSISVPTPYFHIVGAFWLWLWTASLRSGQRNLWPSPIVSGTD